MPAPIPAEESREEFLAQWFSILIGMGITRGSCSSAGSDSVALGWGLRFHRSNGSQMMLVLLVADHTQRSRVLEQSHSKHGPWTSSITFYFEYA